MASNRGGKGGRCVGLTNVPASCADFLEIWAPQPPGTLMACPGLYLNLLTFYIRLNVLVLRIFGIVPEDGRHVGCK
jgi:hypothetical protein